MSASACTRSMPGSWGRHHVPQNVFLVYNSLARVGLDVRSSVRPWKAEPSLYEAETELWLLVTRARRLNQRVRASVCALTSYAAINFAYAEHSRIFVIVLGLLRSEIFNRIFLCLYSLACQSFSTRPSVREIIRPSKRNNGVDAVRSLDLNIFHE